MKEKILCPECNVNMMQSASKRCKVCQKNHINKRFVNNIVVKKYYSCMFVQPDYPVILEK